ncbi:MAG: putative TolA protein of Tol-Pal system [Chlamydiales bacterium]|jgi:outer membrane biosynthesis protein TonB|nr:putative TolA protein of Tol-Pal system [Chlamydiales bacterium]
MAKSWARLIACSAHVKALSLGGKISLSVLAAHILFLALFFRESTLLPLPSAKRVQVHTVALEKRAPALAEKAVAVAKEAVKQEAVKPVPEEPLAPQIEKIEKSAPAPQPEPPPPVKPAKPAPPPPAPKKMPPVPPPVKAPAKAPVKPIEKSPLKPQPNADKPQSKTDKPQLNAVKPPSNVPQPTKSAEGQKAADRRSELIQRARLNLGNLDKSADKGILPAKASRSLSIGALSIESSDAATANGEEGDYFAAIASLLKRHLALPEMGRVKVELTVCKDGHVESIRIVAAESERNKNYVLQKIPHLMLPPLPNGRTAGNRERQKIAITFDNER